jgi:hypothetical protein
MSARVSRRAGPAWIAAVKRRAVAGWPLPSCARVGSSAARWDHPLALGFDEAQGTAVVLQYFDNDEDLGAGADAFAAPDRSETPGNAFR